MPSPACGRGHFIARRVQELRRCHNRFAPSRDCRNLRYPPAGVERMAAVGPKTGGGADGGAGGTPPAQASGRAPGRLLRAFGWTAVAIFAVAGVLWTAGFLWFALRLPTEEAVF